MRLVRTLAKVIVDWMNALKRSHVLVADWLLQAVNAEVTRLPLFCFQVFDSELDFPQLVRTVTNTYWPPVVLDDNCLYPRLFAYV